ncbi:hypothetical protein Prudu_597S000100 [Prunus dulcis]|uniref:Uncharacterized protein n=1 Tax=Prunus dulcis TaxID=3755 RepID=A0A5H2XYN9_PRUDU|nr:hypothetical protein Prudu_597S000100 [Prunus dulcis]
MCNFRNVKSGSGSSFYDVALLLCNHHAFDLAFKRPTQSLEKLMDVMWEEIPNTMAAVCISGMKLSVLGCHYHFKVYGSNVMLMIGIDWF